MTDPSKADLRNLARFRYAIRKLVRFSEEAARNVGITPQHHQLLLGIAGFTGEGWATIRDLAEFLQVRHHSVVGLVDRAQAMGLVRRNVNPDDRREVHVSLTTDGLRKLRMLSSMHRKELNGMRRSLDLLDLEGDRGSRRAVKKTGPSRRRFGARS